MVGCVFTGSISQGHVMMVSFASACAVNCPARWCDQEESECAESLAAHDIILTPGRAAR
jgi:hypothetical protein